MFKIKRPPKDEDMRNIKMHSEDSQNTSKVPWIRNLLLWITLIGFGKYSISTIDTIQQPFIVFDTFRENECNSTVFNLLGYSCDYYSFDFIQNKVFDILDISNSSKMIRLVAYPQLFKYEVTSKNSEFTLNVITIDQTTNKSKVLIKNLTIDLDFNCNLETCKPKTLIQFSALPGNLNYTFTSRINKQNKLFKEGVQNISYTAMGSNPIFEENNYKIGHSLVILSISTFIIYTLVMIYNRKENIIKTEQIIVHILSFENIIFNIPSIHILSHSSHIESMDALNFFKIFIRIPHITLIMLLLYILTINITETKNKISSRIKFTMYALLLSHFIATISSNYQAFQKINSTFDETFFQSMTGLGCSLWDYITIFLLSCFGILNCKVIKLFSIKSVYFELSWKHKNAIFFILCFFIYYAVLLIKRKMTIYVVEGDFDLSFNVIVTLFILSFQIIFVPSIQLCPQPRRYTALEESQSAI